MLLLRLKGQFSLCLGEKQLESVSKLRQVDKVLYHRKLASTPAAFRAKGRLIMLKGQRRQVAAPCHSLNYVRNFGKTFNSIHSLPIERCKHVGHFSPFSPSQHMLIDWLPLFPGEALANPVQKPKEIVGRNACLAFRSPVRQGK